MSYVPVIVPPQPSPRARELGRLLKQTIDGFSREHPGTTSNDIAQALNLARSEYPSGSPALVVGLALGMAVLGALVLFFYSSGGGLSIAGREMIILGLILLGVVAVVMKVIRTR